MNKGSNLNNLTSYVVPVVSLLVVILLVPLVIMPQLTEIQKASAVIKKNNDRLQKIEEKRNKLNDLVKDKEEIAKNLKFIETVLPISKDVAALVLGIQDLARNNGLSVSSFKIQPGKTATASAKKAENETQSGSVGSVTPTSSKENLVFNMTLSGSLASLKTFLVSLETGKRILTLSQVKSAGAAGSFSFDLYLNSPFGSLPDLSGDPAGTPLAELTTENRKLLEDLNTPIFSDITGKTILPGETGPINPFAGN